VNENADFGTSELEQMKQEKDTKERIRQGAINDNR